MLGLLALMAMTLAGLAGSTLGREEARAAADARAAGAPAVARNR